MGVCLSAMRERQLRRHNRLEVIQREFKALLIGDEGSGASAIIKQIENCFMLGKSQEEMMALKLAIYRKLVESAQCLILSMETMSLEPVKPENKAYAENILAYQMDADLYFELSPDIVNAMDSLYHDPITKICMERSSDSRILDSTPNILSQARRIGAAEYTPSLEDIMRLGRKIAGISEVPFDISPCARVNIINIGTKDLYLEGGKWYHCCESILSIIFCVALSDYDHILHNKPDKTRLAESLVIFESIVNSPCFRNTSIILLMTKLEQFSQKIPKIPLEKFFSGYTGGPDTSKAAKYLLDLFLRTNRCRLLIYPLMTSETCTMNSRLIAHALGETILQNDYKRLGIL